MNTTTTTTLVLPGRYGPVPLPEGAIAVMTETGQWLTEENEAKRLSHDNPLMWVSACTVTHVVTARVGNAEVSVRGVAEPLEPPAGECPYRYSVVTTHTVYGESGEVLSSVDVGGVGVPLREPMTVADLEAAVAGTVEAIAAYERHRADRNSRCSRPPHSQR